MPAHIVFKHSPIVEAVFETFFDEATWNDHVATSLQQFCRTQYPGVYDQLQPMLGLQLQFGKAPGGVQFRPAPNPPLRYRYWNSDASRMSQISGDMCALNALPPYTTFADYMPALEALFLEFVRATRPRLLRSVGQRYINRLVLQPNDHPADFLTYFPRLPNVNHVPRQLALHMDADAISGGVVNLTITTQPVDASGVRAFLLDIYARSTPNALPAEWAPVRRWHDEAHRAIRRVFQMTITEKCKRRLGAEEQR